ncbi:MAG: hypothetical protein M5U14_07745 [Acidimicrobiia bacterium]|nr:hypothetical protein [Acidimicrobiia bacterium]
MLQAADRGLAVTVDFAPGRVRISDGAAPGAPVLAGPWLDMARLCSGQLNPSRRAARRHPDDHPRRPTPALAAAGYVLSVPASHYGEETDRRALYATLAVAGLTVAVLVWARHRRRVVRAR